MRNRSSWMERLAAEIELAGEPIPGQPLVEICGENRLLIENHRGVSRYGSEMICVRVAFGEIAVRGCDPTLGRMSRTQLLICGAIDSVALVKRRGRCI